MDTADAIGFYGADDAEKRAAETRNRAFGAKGVVRAFAFLYPLSLVGRLVKRKVCRAAHRVADRAADRVAERAARILRDERVAEERAVEEALEEAEEEAEKNHRAPLFSEVANRPAENDAERAAENDAASASVADIALQCEMEEGAKTRKRILTGHAGRGLTLETFKAGFDPAKYGANLSAPKYHSAPTEGWAFVSEDGE